MATEFKFVSSVLPIEYRNVRIANQAYAVGDAVMLDRVSDAVDVIPATSSTITANIYGIAMSAQLSTDTTLLVALIRPDQLWSADATNTANTNHNEQRMVLTDKGTVNNTGTDSTSSAAIFQQTGTVLQLGQNRIVGRFLAGYATT